VIDTTKKRFALGVILAWAPWVPALVGLSHAVGGISSSKATGLAAIAGGFGEAMVLWGVGMMIVSQVIAIAWLWRSFSREHISRSVISALSIGLSLLMLALTGGYVWILWFAARR
jgi:hypothetical protein